MYLFCYRSFGPRQFSITQKTTWCFLTRSLHPYVVGIPEMLQGNNYSHLDTMVPFALSHIHQRRPRFLHVQMIFGRAFGSSVPCHKDKLIKLYFVSLQLLSKLFLNWIGQVDFRLTRAFWRIFRFPFLVCKKNIFYFISYKNSWDRWTLHKHLQKCVLKRKRKWIHVSKSQIMENSSNPTVWHKIHLTNPVKI